MVQYKNEGKYFIPNLSDEFTDENVVYFDYPTSNNDVYFLGIYIRDQLAAFFKDYPNFSDSDEIERLIALQEDFANNNGYDVECCYHYFDVRIDPFLRDVHKGIIVDRREKDGGLPITFTEVTLKDNKKKVGQSTFRCYYYSDNGEILLYDVTRYLVNGDKCEIKRYDLKKLVEKRIRLKTKCSRRSE